MRRRRSGSRSILLGLVASAFLLAASAALADGSERLGPPSVGVAAGTGIVVAGVGTYAQRDLPVSLRVEVPRSATVKQVLLYWQGRFTSYLAGAGDDRILIDRHQVIGTRIGGPTTFFEHFVGPLAGLEVVEAYRADITALGLVVPGEQSLTVSGMLFPSTFPTSIGPFADGNQGVAVLVVYDEGGPTAAIFVRDGLDLAYSGFGAPLNATVPQTFRFAPAAVPRVATVATLVGSVRGPTAEGVRPNRLVVTFDRAGIGDVALADPWQSKQGAEFDAVSVAVTVPAGATRMTLQGLSGGGTGLAASFGWTAAAVSVPQRPPQRRGVWRSASSCAGGGLPGLLDRTLAESGPIVVGRLPVSGCVRAVRILDRSSIDRSMRRGRDPAYGLAAELLATRLNFAAGATTCARATTAATRAQALLRAIRFAGSGAYAGRMTAVQRSRAQALARSLERYGSRTLC